MGVWKIKLARMLSIIVPALWIAFDVAICLRTGYMTAPFPRWEWWTWLISGGLLGLLSIIAGWRDRRQSDQQHRVLQQGQDVLARGSIEILAKITNSPPDQSLAAISEAAITKIQTLEAKIDELRTSHDDLTAMFGET